MSTRRVTGLSHLTLVISILLVGNASAGNIRAIPKLPASLQNVAPDEIAVPVHLAPVHYPLSQARSRIETVVWIKAFVNKQGDVEKAVVACSEIPAKEFEIIALSATFASEFEPGQRRGKPAFKWVYHPVVFDKKMARKTRKAAKLAAANPVDDAQPVSALFANSVKEIPYPDPDEFVAVEVMPEMLKATTPRYPRLAKKAGIEGEVSIKALIDASGGVKVAYAVKSSGNQNLDRAALNAAVKNKFSPAIQNGQPVAIWVTYKVEFKLDSTDP